MEQNEAERTESGVWGLADYSSWRSVGCERGKSMELNNSELQISKSSFYAQHIKKNVELKI